MSAAQLRALAHPLRVQLLQVLYADGPATASQLARRLGESSGATSYHLRALNRAGMVEEAERRNGRERWWQRPRERMMIPNSVPPEASDRERAELQAAHAQIESIFVERDEQALARWMEIRYDLPLEWQDAQWLGNFRMWATAAEISDFGSAVIELVRPLRKPPESGDSERMEIHFTFRVLPQPPGP
ncbi:MAG TPA: helix-turn-helix domain-containing protein [Gaiellaceae bacterium]|nr:helix-turn-helix domain-containing protein [Gaiellaceae bacterium]